MDKKIIKKKWDLKRVLFTSAGAILLILLAYQFIFADRRSKLKLDKDKLTIATVKKAAFQENIPENGIIQPRVTIYLDAIEGGAIKQVHAESGANLKKGDIIIELTNLNRELSVLSQEASLNESINRVRETRLSLEQNMLNHKQTLAQIDNELAKLTPRFEREKNLFKEGIISKQDFEQTEADFIYNQRRKEITYASFKNDSMGMARQLVQLNQSEIRMIESLNRVGRILDNLVIRSPIDGQLSTPQLFEGQAISEGDRLGQIDVIGSYKVRVPIDEIYLPRITKGLTAKATFARKDYNLTLTYIYPTIVNGEFQVDMEFDEVPEGIRSGLTLPMSIELGASSDAVIIPQGSFFNDTGGQWIFVVNESGDQAEKRNIRLGRKNGTHFEVLDGLSPGEVVITSSYSNLGDNEVLLLN